MHQTLLEQRLHELANSGTDAQHHEGTFLVEDTMMFLSLAAQSLSQDDFTRCFEPKRGHRPVAAASLWWWLWVAGGAVRYGVLLPVRLVLLVVGVGVLLGCLLVARVAGKPEAERWIFTLVCKLWLFSYGAIVRHHGRKPNLPRNHPHLFVANHTSFNDFLVLSSHQTPHGVVAQTHGGLFGVLMRWVLEWYGSVSFNRNEQRDRLKVAEKIRRHINNPSVFAPLLIFPEGTCVNNESTVLFHKGAFELNCTVCPVGLKYNKRLSDPYWNTREQSFTQHVVYLMSRWMMVVDVWWLPPQDRLPGESAIAFADRVKSLISTAAGLKNRSWNGYLKNVMRKLDRDRMHSTSQTAYAGYVKRVNYNKSSESVLSRSDSPASDASSATVEPVEGGPLLGKTSPTRPIAARPPTQPIAIVKQRRHSLPQQHHPNASFPPWLHESAVIDARNTVLSSDAPLLSTATAQLNSLKETVVLHYRRDGRVEEEGRSDTTDV